MNKPEGYRQQDSIGGKFRSMRKAIQGFNQVYTRLSHRHQSGSSDADLQQRAITEYNATNPTFTYLREWEYLRGSSKFHLIRDWDPKSTRGEPTAKRSKTTSGSTGDHSQGSDARVNIDLNTTEEEGSTRETRFYRPIGRDAAKRAARGGASGSSGKAALTDDFEMLGDKLEGLMEVGKQRVEVDKQRIQMEQRKMEMKQEKQDMKTLAIDTSHLPEADRLALEAMKARIRAKWGL